MTQQHGALRLLVDGVVFSDPCSPYVAMWKGVLSELSGRHSLVILDRGNTPALAGAALVPFPAYYGADTAADSALIQEMCAHYEAEVFLSTGYTSPLRTPSVLLVTDMPDIALELAGDRRQMEKKLAIHFARSLLCASAKVFKDLVDFLPWLERDQVGLVEDGISVLAAEIERRLLTIRDEHHRGLHDAFLARWSELRAIQAAVDF